MSRKYTANVEWDRSLEDGTQLALLHRISGIVSSGLTLDSMLGELIGLVATVTGCDACLVYLLEETAGEIVLCASQLPHETEIGNIRLRIGEGVTGWVAQHQSVVALSSRASSDPRFKAFSSLPEDTYESLLSVPLITGGAVIGVINVHHENVRLHTAEEVALLSYVAEQMGGVIARARLMEQSRSAARKVEILAAVGDTISAEGYLDRILQAISEMVAQTFDSPLCSIMILDENRQQLTIKAARLGSGGTKHDAYFSRRLTDRTSGARAADGHRRGYPGCRGFPRAGIHDEARHADVCASHRGPVCHRNS